MLGDIVYPFIIFLNISQNVDKPFTVLTVCSRDSKELSILTYKAAGQWSKLMAMCRGKEGRFFDTQWEKEWKLILYIIALASALCLLFQLMDKRIGLSNHRGEQGNKSRCADVKERTLATIQMLQEMCQQWPIAPQIFMLAGFSSTFLLSWKFAEAI